MATNEAKITFKAETADFQSQIKKANSQLSSLRSELKLNQAQFTNTGDQAAYYQNKLKILESELVANQSKQDALNAEIETATKIFGENSSEVEALQKKLTYAQTEEEKLKTAVNDCNAEMQEQAEAAAKSQTALGKLESEISDQQQEVDELKTAYMNACLEFGETSDEAQELAQRLSDTSSELAENKTKMQAAEDAADDLDRSLDDTGDAADDLADGPLASLEVMLGNLAAQAVTELISKLGDLAQEMIEVGSETETAFAQLETISGSENIDDLTESLTELSNQTGISSSELALTAYNAISAGTSAEDAAEMVEQAAKLATAGFTDTDSALSVLTTAINAYGEDAGTAAEISDSLIQVQNLGVTTIDELAGSMGKAIATASAYNVDLSNLESSYISLTKAGISTEESTTYLSSMLNELGDSGSDVSAILQEQTGKSFGELMEEGYSLGDVLEILNDSVDGDSEALMNLWSSAEAGKASSAIVGQGLDTFNENLQALADSAGSTEEAYTTMTDTFEYQSDRLAVAGENMMVALFDSISGRLGDLAGLGADMINAITDAYTEDGFAGVIQLGADTLVNLANGIIDAIPKMVAALPEVISSFCDFVSDNLPKIADSGGDVLGELISGIISMIPDLVAAMPQIIEAIVTGLIELLPSIAEAGVNIVEGLIEGIISGIGSIGDAVLELGQSIIDGIKSFFGISSPSTVMEEQGGYLVEGLINGISDMPAEFAEYLSETLQNAIEWGASLGENALDAGSDMLNGVIKSVSQMPSKVMTQLNKVITNVASFASKFISKMATAASSALSKLVSGISSMPSKVASTLTGVISKVTSFASSFVSKIKTAATNALSKLVSGIASMPSKVMNTLNKVISKVSSFATSLASKMKTAASNALNKLVSGISSMPTKVMSTLTSVTKKVSSWGSSLVSSFKSIGKNVISGLISGISSMVSSLYSSIKSALSGLVDKAKSALGISSPSKVFAEIGDYMAQGLDVGFTDEMANVSDSVSGSLNDMVSDVNGTAIENQLTVSGDYATDSIGTEIAAMISGMMATAEALASRPIYMYMDGDIVADNLTDRINTNLGKLSIAEARR